MLQGEDSSDLLNTRTEIAVPFGSEPAQPKSLGRAILSYIYIFIPSVYWGSVLRCLSEEIKLGPYNGSELSHTLHPSSAHPLSASCFFFLNNFTKLLACPNANTYTALTSSSN